MAKLNQHRTKFLYPLGDYSKPKLVGFFFFFFPFFLFGIDDQPQIDEIRFNDSIISNSLIKELVATKKPFSFSKLRQIEISLAVDSTARNSFHYHLNAVDTSWQTTPYPLIRYTNLPAANHVLLIHQVGKKDTLSFEFRTNYLAIDNSVPWWLQSLLVFCLMLIPFTIVYFIALNRSRRILQVEKVRNQIASDLHDDVSGNLSAINNLNDLLILTNKDILPASAVKLSDKMKVFTAKAMTKLRHTVWAINPNNDSVKELMDKMQGTAKDLLDTKNIQLEVQNNYNTDLDLQFDMQQRHNTLLIFNELIHNVLKHSEASLVKVAFDGTPKQLTIEVRDNGKGFDVAEKMENGGDGLQNFKRRAADNFMEFDIQSKVWEGTTARLLVYSMS